MLMSNAGWLVILGNIMNICQWDFIYFFVTPAITTTLETCATTDTQEQNTKTDGHQKVLPPGTVHEAYKQKS